MKNALLEKKAVVALESTIITHGMQYPHNFETAMAVEGIIRKEGAVPATIAIINGVIRIGLSKSEIEYLSKNGPKNSRKCSRRDLAYVVARKMNGSTTVAGTMYCASLAGIQVFATGGLGGVHRGAEESFDISADLTELAKTPVSVVSAGIKSILEFCYLGDSRTKLISQLSSGMLQRLKLTLAFLSKTSILFLDEPCANLDDKAISWYQEALKKYKNNRLLIICSNNKEEEHFMCDKTVNLEDYKEFSI